MYSGEYNVFDVTLSIGIVLAHIGIEGTRLSQPARCGYTLKSNIKNTKLEIAIGGFGKNTIHTVTRTNVEELYCYSNEFPNHLFY